MYCKYKNICNPVRTSLISNNKFLTIDDKDYYNDEYSLFPLYPNYENDYVVNTNNKSLHPKQIQLYLGKTFQTIDNDPAKENIPDIKLKDVSIDQIKERLDKIKNRENIGNSCRSCRM